MRVFALLPLAFLLSASLAAAQSSEAPGQSSVPMRDFIDKNSIPESTPMQSTDDRTRAEERLAEIRTRRRGEIIVGKSREALQALAYGEAIDAYVARTAARRDEALAAATAGAPGDAAPIRSALAADLAAWRTAFKLDRTVFEDQRAQWLADSPLLTPADWAKRRVDWFAARDLWIEEQRALVVKIASSD